MGGGLGGGVRSALSPLRRPETGASVTRTEKLFKLVFNVITDPVF